MIEPKEIAKRIPIHFGRNGGGHLELSFQKRSGMIVGTDPLIGRFLGVCGMAEIWFHLSKNSQSKVINDPLLKQGFVPDWLWMCYERGRVWHLHMELRRISEETNSKSLSDMLLDLIDKT